MTLAEQSGFSLADRSNHRENTSSIRLHEKCGFTLVGQK